MKPLKFYCIDSHNHVHPGPDGKFDQAQADMLLKAADKLGIDKLCVSVPLTDPCPTPEEVRAANDVVLAAMAYSNRFYGFAFINPGFAKEAIAEIDRCIVAGGISIHFVEEMTPMMIAELIQLSAVHKVIICEGDIDYSAVASVATHIVHLCNQSTTFDWFDRPDHDNIRDIVAKRTDLSDEEKQKIIDHAYECVTPDESSTTDWVTELGIRNIIWNDQTSIDTTATEVAEYFGFTKQV